MHRSVAAIALMLVSTLSLLPQVARGDDPLWVGVLENVDGGDFLSPAMKLPHVRVAFAKQGTDWIAASTSIPGTIKWTVVFDGKALGTITSAAFASAAYGDLNTQTLTGDVPRNIFVSNGAATFDYGVRAKSRPLVAVSEPNSQDPEGWKPTTLSSKERQRAVKAFREKVQSSERCDQPEQQPIHWVPYADASIRLVKAYRSKIGTVILGLSLDDKGANCGFFDDETFFDYWFVLRDSGPVKLLGSQMMPVDAVDLDNSGTSAWIFLTSRGEDHFGYELFYEGFAKNVSFSWAYH